MNIFCTFEVFDTITEPTTLSRCPKLFAPVTLPKPEQRATDQREYHISTRRHAEHSLAGPTRRLHKMASRCDNTPFIGGSASCVFPVIRLPVPGSAWPNLPPVGLFAWAAERTAGLSYACNFHAHGEGLTRNHKFPVIVPPCRLEVP